VDSSSTSNSDSNRDSGSAGASAKASAKGMARLPWAGLLVIVVILSLETFTYQHRPFWAWVVAQDPFGVAASRLALLDLKTAPGSAPRVAVVGTSRVHSGFDVATARRDRPEYAWAKLSDPRFEAFVLRNMVDDLLSTDPAAVVFLLSEMDTNRPVRLEPIPGPSVVSLSALRELLQWAGTRFAIEHRTTFYRLLATKGLRTYRYRSSFEDARLESLVTFSLDERLGTRLDSPRKEIEFAITGGKRNFVSKRWRKKMNASFPVKTRRFFGPSVDLLSHIALGPHTSLNQLMLLRTVELLRQNDVEVIVVEAPVHPAAGEIYDSDLRAAFLEFAGDLETRYGLHFVSLEAMPSFGAKEFIDMVHLDKVGARKLTQAIERAVVAALDPEAPGLGLD